ncbi:MAG: hypothetical protein CL947_04745 [Epsilonproteobacteria bacterium]|nr:hypothetical protein [Campylobacterota bacterium]
MQVKIYSLFFICMCNMYQVMVADTLKKVAETPVSTSIKHILEHVSSTDIHSINQQAIKPQIVIFLKGLRSLCMRLLDKHAITVDDVHTLAIKISEMKQILLNVNGQLKQKCVHEVMLKFNIDTAVLLNLLDVSAIDQDIAYAKEQLLYVHNDYSNKKPIEVTVPLRILSIIEELLHRYDGILISAYTVIVLLQVALNAFMLAVVC